MSGRARVSFFTLRSLYKNKHCAFDTSLVCMLNSQCLARKVNEERKSATAGAEEWNWIMQESLHTNTICKDDDDDPAPVKLHLFCLLCIIISLTDSPAYPSHSRAVECTIKIIYSLRMQRNENRLIILTTYSCHSSFVPSSRIAPVRSARYWLSKQAVVERYDMRKIINYANINTPE